MTCMDVDNTTTAWLGGHSPQYDVERLDATMGSARGIARLYRTHKDAAFAITARHALPRAERPQWPNEMAFLRGSPVTRVWLRRANRGRAWRLHPSKLSVISVAPEDESLTFRLLVADGDPEAHGATTLVGWTIVESPWGYGPAMADRMRQSITVEGASRESGRAGARLLSADSQASSPSWTGCPSQSNSVGS